MALDRNEMNERVLDIAQTLLNEGGATNLKARSIAEKAGIAVGSIYNLFGDLDQVHGFVNMRLLDGLAPRRQPPKTVPPLRRPEVQARLAAR